MGEWPAIDSRQYILAFDLASAGECPPDFALPSSLAGFDAGVFLPRDDPDWFGRSNDPPRILLLKDTALYIVSHPSTREQPRQYAMEQIASVESGHMLLKGWLRFSGSGFDYTVRYNTRGFPAVYRFMRSFRDRLLGGIQAAETPVVHPGAGLDIKFGNALATELDPGEIVRMQVFQPPRELRSRLWLLPYRHWIGRFAGADRQAAALDYRPRARILFAIRDHRFVCPVGRRAKHRCSRRHSPRGPERRLRVASPDRFRKRLGLPACGGRSRGGAGDLEEAQ